MSFRKTFPFVKITNNTLLDLPAPINLTANWNYGSLLGLCLVNQIATGLFLSMRYTADTALAFDSVVAIMQDVNYGWLVRLMHASGATVFFFFMYLHIGRGIYYGSFMKTALWNVGVVIYLIVMGTAFLGYVLPWGQMSYWAATVITNLLSAIPIVGSKLTVWVWGGFAVGNSTLQRFYSLHFLLPFVVVGLVVMHLFYLHQYTSSNPLGVDSSPIKAEFHYLYVTKDLLFILIFFLGLVLFSCIWGFNFMDPENFIPANALVTPTHIQPEWYFLFAYAILRAVPDKLGGVLALLASVLVLFLFPVQSKKSVFTGFQHSVIGRLLFWSLVTTFLLLTWLGAMPAEYPFIHTSQYVSVAYFTLVSAMWLLSRVNNGAYLCPPKTA